MAAPVPRRPPGGRAGAASAPSCAKPSASCGPRTREAARRPRAVPGSQTPRRLLPRLRVTRWQRAVRGGRIIALALRMAVELAVLERRRAHLDPEEFQALQERLLRRQSVRLRETAVDLGGLLIKLGQFLSTRVDVLPAAFTEELAGLRDAVPALP